MNTGCEDLSTLLESAHALIAYRKQLEKWLHGTETEDVILGGVATPTIKKLVATIDERESQAAQEVVDEAVSTVVAIRNKLLEIEQEIFDEVAKLTGIDAHAVPLPAGASPTADYDATNGTLTLGIPAGATGAIGPAGPPGQAPTIDEINCGGADSIAITDINGGNAESFGGSNAEL